MSYLVLARKYRPQTFADLVGQEHVTRTLTNAIKLGRIAHGYLFTGTRGVGKTTVARIFAKSLNCESAEGPTPEPCGTCPSCKEIAASTSPDVFEIDAASNTGVDDVRELRENVKYLPSRGRYKVYIIDEVHMLSKSAFNALLKTLEEPPPHVVFIFATTEVHKIPDTVLSRTQQYEFKMISLAEIAAYLKRLMKAEKAKVSDDVLMLVARKAAGSVRDGLSYMDQVLSYGPDRPLTEIANVLGVVDRQALLDISAAVLAVDPVAVLDVLERLGTSNWDVKDFLSDLLEHFRNLVAAKLARHPEGLIDAGEAEITALREQVKDAAIETLEHLFNLLAEAEELILRSGQPRLVLEMTLVRLAQGAKVTSLNNLIDQLIEWKQSPPVSGGGGDGKRTASHRQPNQPAGATRTAPAARVAPPAKPAASKPAIDPEKDPAEAFLQAVKQQRPAVAAQLRQHRIEWVNGHVEIHLPSGFVYNSMERESGPLTAVAQSLFGEQATIILHETDKSNSPAARLEQQMKARQEADRARRQVEQESLEHPTVKMILEVFPAAEVTVTPIEKRPKE
ncbi:MAG: DNA polymerase III subunit gamma/tau [Candidatus Lernaella stagnicola]|nr:DNA polymerase III subunit gamma/tau [Candidatus Lernaella stagnicola]